ncbi:outer membrane protein assembly factor BamA [Sulfitobacter sp.]|uniref:outer membrane protein assembly factor BamA n=1 Tax=Sulfitobacter sp. TaxID=1903071 RepID=UPI003296C513
MNLGSSTSAPRAFGQHRKANTGLKGLAFSLLITTAWIAPAPKVFAQQFQFNTVRIEGNERIGDSAILSQAGIARGQALSAGQLNDAVQKLNNSGLFESVEVTPQGNTLTISVVELPTINRISFEGNRRIDDDALAGVIDSTARRVFNPTQAEKDANSIAEAYSAQGRISARVQPKIIKRDQNRVDLVFEIFEGENIEVERLSFVGNRKFSDRRLRRVLGTKQAGLFRVLIQRDSYNAGRVELDKQILRDFYASRGYVDMRINSVNANLTEERDGYFIGFNIQEGQQFHFGDISVTSELNGVDADLYRSLIKVKPGVVYSPTLVDLDIARIEREAIRQGVDFLRVEPRVTRNERDLTLNVEFVLSRGPRIFIERIDIEGNTTTLDRVVRRQFDSVEGDPFNPREIRQSAERIRALGYFENANVETREGSSADQVVIDVDVVEQPTGSLNFGASFSSGDGPGIAVSFSEQNFLGRGQQLSLNVATATEARRLEFRFTEPSLLARDVAFSLGANFAETNSSNSTYDTSRFTFQPSITFPVSENGRLQLRYTGERIKVKRNDDDDNGEIIQGDIDAGALITSSLGYQYSYDTRRTGLDPTAGVLLQLNQDFAGLGGDQTYVRTVGRAIGEKKFFNEQLTLRATAEAGALNFISGTNRAVDRFILSTSQLRGFEPGGIGPRDGESDESDTLGGNFYVVGRLEAEFPIGLPEEYGITGGVFYDVGNLWDLSDVDLNGVSVDGENGSFRHVIGFSIFWDTPVGPLQFNVSDAIRKESFDREQKFEVTIQTDF